MLKCYKISSLNLKVFYVSVSKIFQGRSDGGYIGIYISPKSVYLTNFYVFTGCFFFSLTQDKLLLILKLE